MSIDDRLDLIRKRLDRKYKVPFPFVHYELKLAKEMLHEMAERSDSDIDTVLDYINELKQDK